VAVLVINRPGLRPRYGTAGGTENSANKQSVQSKSSWVLILASARSRFTATKHHHRTQTADAVPDFTRTNVRETSIRYNRLDRNMPGVDWIRELCLSFPEVIEVMPWGDDLCFKVRGKIFAGVVLSDGRFPRITLKCSQEAFHELLEVEGIVPAPYVGRYKWIQLSNSNLLPASQLESLLRQSYDLVIAKAPKKKPSRAPGKRVSTKKTLPKRRSTK
jgi:predicted DNA-binding protein (MmcQ/YjbR family)